MTARGFKGNKAEAAYRRGDLFDKRRHLMDAWAQFCATLAYSGQIAAHSSVP